MTRSSCLVAGALLLYASVVISAPAAAAAPDLASAPRIAKNSPTDVSAARRHYRYVNKRWRVVQPYPTYGYYGPRPRFYRPYPYYAPIPFVFGYGYDPYYW
jgi:hypothetical protein